MKGQESPTWILASFFDTNGKNAYKICNNCQKLSIIMMWSSVIGSESKISISHELHFQEESEFAGLLSCPKLKITCKPLCDKVQLQSFRVDQKWLISYEFLLSGRAYMPKYLFQRIIFAQNGKNSLRNINISLKIKGNKAQAIKFMMSALNITIR